MLGSYSVVQCMGCLMGQPLYCSAADAGMCVGREALVMAPPATRDSAVSPSMAAWLSSTGISHHNLLPHIPSICLLCLPGDQHSCKGCMAVARTV